ncbi:MAG TPA: UbiA family prenyltransferase, partial [Marmoricola sp.]|nr:UbiA family prenyltransferase [Marmoricola sp.]
RVAAGEVCELGRSFEGQSPSLGAFVRMLRPYQWVKNVLVLLALVTAQRLNDPAAVWHALAGAGIFCVLASSVYVLNDLVDLDNDRRHPIKQRRPLASGTVSLLTAWLTWPTLLVVAFTLSVLLEPTRFSLVLLAYYLTTVAYSFWLKPKPIADVVTLAGLYSVRVIAGVYAIQVSVSIWLLTFSLFFFLTLALIKRVSELTRIRREGGAANGRGYRNTDLELLSSYGVSSGIAAVVIFSLYVNDHKTAGLYQSPDFLWGALPILLAWSMRAWLIAHRGELDEDPILFAAKDRWSLTAGLAIAALFLAAKVVHG